MGRIVSQLDFGMLMSQFRKATKAKNHVILFDDSFTVKGCISEFQKKEISGVKQLALSSSWQ